VSIFGALLWAPLGPRMDLQGLSQGAHGDVPEAMLWRFIAKTERTQLLIEVRRALRSVPKADVNEHLSESISMFESDFQVFKINWSF